MRPKKQRHPPSSCGTGYGRESKATPTPRHPNDSRSDAFRSAPCSDYRPHSAQRGRIPGSASGAGPRGAAGMLGYDARVAGSRSRRFSARPTAPGCPIRARLGRALRPIRSCGSGSRSWRARSEPGVGSRRRRCDPEGARREQRGGGGVGEPRASPAGSAAATLRSTLASLWAASQVTALCRGRVSVRAREGPLRWSGPGAGRPRGPSAAGAARAPCAPAPASAGVPGKARHFHTPRAPRSGRRGGESV